MRRTKIFYIIPVLSLLVCCSLDSNGQSDYTTISKQLDKYSQNTLQEKIYAQTDKNTYLAGELIWFKLYNVDADFHELLEVSKVAYVEVLNKEHAPVAQAKISLNHGIGNGSFELPVDIKTGNYFFRVYTNWMIRHILRFAFSNYVINCESQTPRINKYSLLLHSGNPNMPDY